MINLKNAFRLAALAAAQAYDFTERFKQAAPSVVRIVVGSGHVVLIVTEEVRDLSAGKVALYRVRLSNAPLNLAFLEGVFGASPRPISARPCSSSALPKSAPVTAGRSRRAP